MLFSEHSTPCDFPSGNVYLIAIIPCQAPAAWILPDLTATDSERENMRDYQKYLVKEQPQPVPYFWKNKKKKEG